jgi:CRISPR-associated protein Cas2
MGWILVMFDLPVVEAVERRLASKFRQSLLDLGYFMLQESVYVRNCVSHEKMEQYQRDVKAIAPLTGSISLFYITDKQWEISKSFTLLKEPRSRYGIQPNRKQPEQLSFW